LGGPFRATYLFKRRKGEEASRRQVGYASMNKPDCSEDLPPSLVATQYGVWRLVRERETSSKKSHAVPTWSSLSAFGAKAAGSNILRFSCDVYRLAPGTFVVYGSTFGLLAINEALKLKFLNNVFNYVRLDLIR
jgi:hypothetical protein